MRAGVRLALASAALLVPSGALAQQAAQPAEGGYYELPDYSYFPQQPITLDPVEPPVVDPTPEPPTLPPVEEPVPAPAPTPAPPPPPAPAPTPTPPPVVEPVPEPTPSPPPPVVEPTPSPSPTPAPTPAPAPVYGASSGATSTYQYPQGDMAAAKAQAKELGTAARAGSAGIATSTDLTSTIPGYTGQTLPMEAYADDPDAIVSNGAASAAASDPYRTVTSPVRPVVTLDRSVVARANAVEDDPHAYTSGASLAGGTGSCQPLPPGSAGTGTYEATCSVGTQVSQGPKSCPITLTHNITDGGHKYRCTRWQQKGRVCLQGDFATWCSEPDWVDESVYSGCGAFEQSGTCSMNEVSSTVIFNGTNRTAPTYYETFEATCSSQVTPTTTGGGNATYPIISEYLGLAKTYLGSVRDESRCQALASDSNCSAPVETCTSSDPVTRVIDGISITQPCWAWNRTYQCTLFSQASDCSTLESNPSCTYQSETCLDDPQSGACKVAERLYKCPIPGNAPTQPAEYICSGDVYCINGACEPIEREASTEFKDALVGLHTLGQANAEFDEATLMLFSGTRETCHSKVFGLSNCCSGKGLPLLTPWLCDSAERQLDTKDDAGLCHKVGTYCSDKILGVCVTKKTAYCCFSSKLTRILQEQGRPQLGIPWGSPKTEQCRGFTLDQFSMLDLSKMDFTEIYSEFVDAAKLPDEIQTMQTIQQRIEAYFQQNKPS